MKLSIGMMIKNEEKYLNACLESLKPLLENIESELVIIDTGSTDDSAKIAKHFTDKFFTHPWNDNFSEMRNKVISYCVGEWVMVIDGDEILQNPTEIISFFNAEYSKKFNTALVMVKNLTDEKDLGSFSIISSPRLFRKDEDFHYEGAVHNQPIFKAPIAKIDSYLLHYGYISTDKELMEKKFIRTVSLLKKELEQEPTNFYYWCQLSISYSMHNEHKKAMDMSIKAYEVLKNAGLNSGEYIYVYMQLAYSYLMNKQYEKARDICLEGINLKSGILDLYFYLAKSQMMTKDYRNAIHNYKEYLTILKNIQEFKDTNVSLYTLGKYEYAYYDLVIAFNEIGEFRDALEFSKKISEEKLINLNLDNIITICLKLKEYDYLCYCYKSIEKRIDIQGKFERALETYKREVSNKDKFEILNIFKDVQSIYGVLNKVRYSLVINEHLDFDLNDYLRSNVSLDDLPDYYGDFLYYLLINNIDISNVLRNIRELDFNRFFVYLKDKYNEFGQTILSYLRHINFTNEIHSLRIKKALYRYVILSADLDNIEFSQVFKQYVEDGMLYINSIYSDDIILNESIYEVKNEEEAFFIYMIKANSVKDLDKKVYIQYLRKALNIYPYMNNGVKNLLEEFENETNTVNSELELYKLQVKSTIKNLISNGDLKSAKSIIDEYEKIIQDDMEIVLFKSEIAVKEFDERRNKEVQRFKM